MAHPALTIDTRENRGAIKNRLRKISDRTAACRGDHHDWPILKPGPLPDGITIEPTPRRGVYQVKVTCRECGRWRMKTTLPGRWFDPDAVWQYGGGPEDFSEAPGMGMTKRDYAAELGRRIASDLADTVRLQAKKRAQAAADQEATESRLAGVTS